MDALSWSCQSIGNLKLLRYLNLSRTGIFEIPDTVCTLYNLQTLLLSRCGNLILLPSNIGRLVNLRHLDITSTDLTEMPLEMGRLKSLQTLSDFLLRSHSGSTIKLVTDLQNLHGRLDISGLENVIDVEDVLAANLKDKKYLSELKFHWRLGFDDFQNDREVLNGLQPHTNLKVLRIENYKGERFSKWVGDHSFCNMEQIRLVRCRKCCLFPPLGQLSFLKKLVLEGFDELVKIDDEFYYGGCSMSKPFRCLEFLKFENMRKLKEWTFIEDVFSQLKELVLKDCPKLSRGLSLPDTIETVEISKCHEIELLGKQCYASLRCLKIFWSCASLKSIPLDYFPMLNEIDLSPIKNLKSLAFSEEPPHPALHSLTCFSLRHCPEFVSFPQGGLSASNMKVFVIENCKNLKLLPDHMLTLLPSLQSLEILNCPKLESFPECGLPSNLKQLAISKCCKLYARRMQWDLQRFTSLTILHINNIDEVLDSFPEEGLLPITLIPLSIHSFPHLKALNGKALQKFTSLESLSIAFCGELQLLPEEELPIYLSYLEINKCA